MGFGMDFSRWEGLKHSWSLFILWKEELEVKDIGCRGGLRTRRDNPHKQSWLEEEALFMQMSVNDPLNKNINDLNWNDTVALD